MIPPPHPPAADDPLASIADVGATPGFAPPPEAPEDPLAGLFAAARAQLGGGAPRAGGSALLFVSLLVFVFSVGPGATPTSIAVLVAVLFVHELGHYLGMRAFGYRDVRMFFVPFLGAAVSGRRGTVAAWKDAIVLLLGPVPGVWLGGAVLFATGRWPVPLLVQLGETLLLVNAFNLLPFGGLDGGKLLLRVIFSRHRYLELAFTAMGALALGGVAIAVASLALGFFAIIGLVALGRRARVLESAARLRPELEDATAATLDDASARRLFDETRNALGPPLANDARAVANGMEDVLVAAQRPPGVLASIVLLGMWAGTCFVALVCAVVLAHALSPADWQRRTYASYSVELPDDTMHRAEVWSTPAGERTAQVEMTSLDIVEHFSVIDIDAGREVAPGERAAWAAMVRTRLEEELGVHRATSVSDSDVQLAGRSAVESVWTNGWRRWRTRTLIVGQHVYTLIASSPEGTSDETRFLDSFQLVGP